jgi:hypothetical protein
MKHDEAWEALSDYVDGALPETRMSAIRAHLADCEHCRREEAALRELLSAARELPESVQPQRDLWPGIASRLEPADATPESDPARGILAWLRPRGRGFGLVAAAALLLIVALIVGRRGPGNGDAGRLAASGEHESVPQTTGEATVAGLPAGEEGATTAAPIDPVVLGTIAVLDAECREGDMQLAVVQAQAGATSGPSGLRKIVEGLGVIDRAIAEAKAAWAADPHSPHLARMVMAAYRAKASLQRQAAQLPTPS